MIELFRDLRVINVLAKFENDPWKIMDVRVLTGACLPARPPARVRQYPGALKGKISSLPNKYVLSQNSLWLYEYLKYTKEYIRYKHSGGGGGGGVVSKTLFELVNLGAHKCFFVNKLHFFQYMGEIFCVEFQISDPYIERDNFYSVLKI